ncbi:HAD family phosphatase [Siccirubricoccus sp. KC 17139]|uniref:HAD family phosphatase n=1 Tax=Siccirubricoccus soli TaxID=2899147 RepID=A0ABT1CZA1_9PROT|nr:HAD family phosphatase [Siccirubricoccus soli]MCO6414982.1 HAD family phosphatase [Siccirubricoccus soli]MCP2681113.1 HAD family phosphatase [Siccirubricoccus soli]
MPPRNVVFDLGGVLIDWDPRHLYRKLFPGDAPGMERFLAEVCTGEWNLAQDAGRSWAEATALLKAQHPEKAALIDAYHLRWPEMIAGPIEGTVAVLAELHAQGTPLYGLTNWSAETYPVALERFDFMAWFRGVVVSGTERIVKPDPRIYRLLLERFGLAAAETVFIDDKPRNAAAASALGMHGVHFTTPEALRLELVGLGVLAG